MTVTHQGYSLPVIPNHPSKEEQLKVGAIISPTYDALAFDKTISPEIILSLMSFFPDNRLAIYNGFPTETASQCMRLVHANRLYLDNSLPKSELFELLGNLRAEDEVAITVTREIKNLILPILPYLNERILFCLTTEDINATEELITNLPANSVLSFQNELDQSEELRLLNALKPGSFYLSKPRHHNPSVLLARMPQGIKYLHWRPMFPPRTNLGKKIKNLIELQTENKVYRENQKIRVIIDRTTPPEIIRALPSSRKANIWILDNLNTTQINALPKQVKKVFISPQVSVQIISTLKLKNIRINFNIEMGVSRKYLGFAPLTLPRESQEHVEAQHLPANHGVPETFVDLTSFHALSNPRKEGPLAEMRETYINEHGFDLKFISKQGPLDPEDPVAFVYAGRKENAKIPSTNQVRVIMVLTRKEYNAMDERAKALAPVDFLVIDRIERPYKEGPDKPHTITSRRYASLYFSYQLNLNRILMLDDNIDKIYVATEAPAQPDHEEEEGKQSEPVSFNFDRVQHLMNEEMNRTGALFISVSSRSYGDKTIRANGLGSKCHLWDLQNIRLHLTTVESFLTLMPENEQAWGQVLFAQILLKTLPTLQREPVHIIAKELLQLERSQTNKNATQQQGVIAKKITLSDPYQRYLRAQGRNLFELVFRAAFIFKTQLARAEENILKRDRRLATMNLESHQAELHGITPQEMPLPDLSTPFRERFKRTLAIFLNSQEEISNDPRSIIKPFPHQWNALKALYDSLDREEELNKALFEIATGCGKTLIQALIALSALAASDKTIVVVTPYQNLTRQTYDAFIDYINGFPLLTERLGISKSKILKVYSDDPLAIQQRNLIRNEEQQARYLYITCKDSFVKLIENEGFRNNIEMILFDESHLTAKKEYTESFSEREAKPIFLHFSATASKFDFDGSNLHFSYNRNDGIEDGFLASLKVKRLATSSEDELSEELILQLISRQQHPNGGCLVQNKGIIFVKDQESVNMLGQAIKRQFPHLPCFQISSDNTKRHQDLRHFKESQNGIAIAIKMLAEGFDDKRVNWALVLRIPSPSRLTQMIGRILRTDSSCPGKIGLLIGYHDLKAQSTFSSRLMPRYLRSFEPRRRPPSSAQNIREAVSLAPLADITPPVVSAATAAAAAAAPPPTTTFFECPPPRSQFEVEIIAGRPPVVRDTKPHEVSPESEGETDSEPHDDESTEDTHALKRSRHTLRGHASATSQSQKEERSEARRRTGFTAFWESIFPGADEEPEEEIDEAGQEHDEDEISRPQKMGEG